MISRAAILKAAEKIKARKGCDDADALRLAEKWAAEKNATAAAPAKPAPIACIMPPEAQAKGIRSPRCRCYSCFGSAVAEDRKNERIYRGSSGNW